MVRLDEEWEKAKASKRQEVEDGEDAIVAPTPKEDIKEPFPSEKPYLDKILEEILELRPIERISKIEETATMFQCDVSVIKDELKQFEKRQKDNLKIERDKEKVEDKKHKEELKILSQERKTEEKAEMQKERRKLDSKKKPGRI